MHLVAGHLLAVDRDELALEADVGGLDARARVGAAVDVEADRMRQLELLETLLEVEHGRRRVRLRLDDRELAELDAGARDRAAADEARPRRRARVRRGPAMSDSTRSSGMSRMTSFWCGRRAQAGRAVRLDEIGELREGRARDAADDRRGADVEAAVLLRCTPTWSPCVERLRRGRAVGQRVAEVLVLQHLAELLGAPLGEQELQARLVAQAPVAVVAEDLRDAVPGIRHLIGRARTTPRRSPRRGAVDRPPPTHRS